MKVDHTVGPVVSGRLHGPNLDVAKELVAEGPVVLALRSGSGGVELEAQRQAGPEQVLRALRAAGVITADGAEGERLHVRLRCEEGADEAVYSADLGHRLLYRRVYDPAGPVATWFGLNPFLADLQGSPAETPRRPSMRNVVGVLHNVLGELGTLNILNLFTRRARGIADIEADGGDRLVHDELIREALRDTDVVLPAWGSKAGERHLPQVRRLLELADRLGLRVVLRARDGQPLHTSRWPQQPQHPRLGGYKALSLIEAPQRWRDDFVLEAPACG